MKMPSQDISAARFGTPVVFLVAFLALAAIGAMFIGAYRLNPTGLFQVLAGEGEPVERYLVWQLRLPRILLAMLVGAGLAITGAAVQGLFRNPLAEPTFIGITSGAMLFAVLALVFSYALLPWLPAALQQFLVSLSAFAGALLTTWMVYSIASRKGRLNVTSMLLAGIAITALAGAFTGLMVYKSSEEQLRDITFWTLGSLAGTNWIQVAVCAPIVLIGGMQLHRHALALNAFLLGENEAALLGFQVRKTKRKVIIWTALMVGACVSVTGLIGFVGLVIPHLLRLRFGTDYRKLLLYSMLLGAGFMVVADTLARTIVAPAELPIGIITAIVGAPFFLWLLLRQRTNLLPV